MLLNVSRLNVLRVFVMLLLVCIVSACSGAESNEEAKNFVDKLVIHSSVDAVRDPLLAQGPEQRFLVALENRRLFKLSSSGELKPDLANTYRFSDDGTEIIVSLSENTFSDDSPITSTDVKATLSRVAISGGELASLVNQIVGSGEVRSGKDFSGIKTPDDKTVVFQLVNPNPFFVYSLVHPATSIIPASQIDAQGTFTAGIHSGLYISEDVSNEIDSISTYQPRIENIPKIEVVKKSAKSLREIPPDENVDIVLGSTVEADGFKEIGLNRLAVASWNIYVPNSDSPLANRKFREAILLALDQEEAIEAYGERAVLPVKFTGDTFDSVECGQYCDTDRERAQELIKEIYPDLEVPLITLDIEKNVLQKELAESAQKRLNDIGVPTEIREYPPTELSNVIARGEANLFRFGWVSDTAVGADALIEYFKADSTENVSGILDEDLEEKISLYSQAKLPQEKLEASKEVQERVKNLWLMRPIAQFQSKVVVNEKLSGFNFDLYGILDIQNLRQF